MPALLGAPGLICDSLREERQLARDSCSSNAKRPGSSGPPPAPSSEILHRPWIPVSSTSSSPVGRAWLILLFRNDRSTPQTPLVPFRASPPSAYSVRPSAPFRTSSGRNAIPGSIPRGRIRPARRSERWPGAPHGTPDRTRARLAAAGGAKTLRVHQRPTVVSSLRPLSALRPRLPARRLVGVNAPAFVKPPLEAEVRCGHGSTGGQPPPGRS